MSGAVGKCCSLPEEDAVEKKLIQKKYRVF